MYLTSKMKDTERIQKVLDKCGATRHELNTVHWRKMRGIQRAFSKMLDVPKKVSGGLNQYFHYKNGGYPSENSPPRYEDAAEKLANMFIGAEFIDESEVINRFLEKKFGLKLVRVRHAAKLKRKALAPLEQRKLQDMGISHLEEIKDDKKLFSELHKIMDETQCNICQLSDSIKYTGFAQVEKKMKGLRKSSFIRLVGTKAAGIKSPAVGRIRKNETLCDVAQLNAACSLHLE